MKIDRLLCLALATAMAAALPLAAPVQAQRTGGVMTIFGDDKCPTDPQGNEIVVCRRLPESERNRIPLELRHSEVRDSTSPSERAATIDSVGRSGIGSCSAVGSAGASGCARQEAKAACDEAKAQGKKCGIGF